MPFPPNFDNAWSNTFPPDTQAANLLGADLRAFRTDVQQRLSLLSGTLANRPANMDATFGGAANGILFFATDTGQIFQWNGAAWVDVTANVVGGKVSNGVPVNTSAALDGIIATIPANSLKAGSIVEVTAFIANSDQNTVSLFFGATGIGNFKGAAGTSILTIKATILCLSGIAAIATSIAGFGTGVPGVGSGAAGGAAALVIDVTQPINVKTAEAVALNGTVMTHEFITVTWR